jgi:hypothetical protein
MSTAGIDLTSGIEGLPEAAAFPDPLLSANVYATRRLDQIIARLAVPFLHAAEAIDPSQSFYLWVLRYARCGEHLKLRVHGPDSLRGSFGRLLEAAFEAYHASQDFAEEILPLSPRPTPPRPMDLEDQAQLDDYSNGTFLLTRYQRSPIVFGAPALCQDDGYVARFTRCLGQAFGIIVESFELDETGNLPHRRRQALLLRVLAIGLPAIFPLEEDLHKYIAYHRDWLVRARTLALRGRMALARQTLDRYDVETVRTASSLTGIQDLLRAPGAMSLREEEWRRSLVALRSYLQGALPANPDPFVPGPLFPSLFKVFHCVANQIGLTSLNEGLAWHLLLRALKGNEDRDSFRLVPF